MSSSINHGMQSSKSSKTLQISWENHRARKISPSRKVQVGDNTLSRCLSWPQIFHQAAQKFNVSKWLPHMAHSSSEFANFTNL
jgi:hypothetical protein